VPKADWTEIGPVRGLLGGLRMVGQFGVYTFRASRIGGGIVAALGGWCSTAFKLALYRSSPPDAFGLENEFDGFADRAMPARFLVM